MKRPIALTYCVLVIMWGSFFSIQFCGLKNPEGSNNNENVYIAGLGGQHSDSTTPNDSPLARESLIGGPLSGVFSVNMTGDDASLNSLNSQWAFIDDNQQGLMLLGSSYSLSKEMITQDNSAKMCSDETNPISLPSSITSCKENFTMISILVCSSKQEGCIPFAANKSYELKGEGQTPVVSLSVIDCQQGAPVGMYLMKQDEKQTGTFTFEQVAHEEGGIIQGSFENVLLTKLDITQISTGGTSHDPRINGVNMSGSFQMEIIKPGKSCNATTSAGANSNND